MPIIDVAFTPSEDLLDGAVVIVVDVIRATTTILHALAGGFAEVWCAGTVEEARAVSVELGSSGVLAGEREGVAPHGFALGNSPLAFTDPPAAGQTLILTTTNGTAAIIRAVDAAGEVLVGALVNLGPCATAAAELALARDGNVVVCCAGVSGRSCLDDTYVAGRLVSALGSRLPGYPVTDAARMAQLCAASFTTPEDALRQSAGGRALLALGDDADLMACARLDVLTISPRAEPAGDRVVVRR
jgi:2-phosphosulfolactate phosphatase